MVKTYPQKQSQIDAPDYWDPRNTTQEQTATTDNPLLLHEPPEENPEEALKKKYPVKVIAGAIVLVITVLAIPVGIYLNQRPTSVFIDADTPTPIATFPPTETPSPTPTATP